jgi:RHS repeat-associated protein
MRLLLNELICINEYNSYGCLTSNSGNNGNANNPFTYTGREDVGLGLSYNRARYYDSSIERFISDDPMGDGQRYVKGNPLVYIDPMGLYYKDFNSTFILPFVPTPIGGVGFGTTTGILNDGKCNYDYQGIALGIGTIGASYNYSEQNISPGLWALQFSGGLGPTSFAGGFDQKLAPFFEVGLSASANTGPIALNLSIYKTNSIPLKPSNILRK